MPDRLTELQDTVTELKQDIRFYKRVAQALIVGVFAALGISIIDFISITKQARIIAIDEINQRFSQGAQTEIAAALETARRLQDADNLVKYNEPIEFHATHVDGKAVRETKPVYHFDNKLQIIPTKFGTDARFVLVPRE